VVKTFRKGISIHGEVIHKYFKETFPHVGENTEHTTLERRRCIAQPKGHALVCSERTRKGGLLLIFGSNQNLIIPRITIKKAVVLLASRSSIWSMKRRGNMVCNQCILAILSECESTLVRRHHFFINVIPNFFGTTCTGLPMKYQKWFK